MKTVDPLISEYLPVVKGQIAKKYWWIEDRGNCLLTTDDLIQVASIALVTLTNKWDDILADQGATREDMTDGRLFWHYLKSEVKWMVLNAIKRQAKLDQDNHTTNWRYDAHAEELWGEDVRTALTRHQDPSILQADIAEYFALMPPYEKTILALRHFDELSFPQISDLLGVAAPLLSEHATKAINRWRVYARNQYLDTPEYLPRHPRRAWEPPTALVDYLQSRHHADIHEYLGVVTISFRVDVSYMVDILGGRRFTGTANHPNSRLTDEQRKEIDRLTGEGMNAMEVSRRLDIPYGSVRYQIKFRRGTVG